MLSTPRGTWTKFVARVSIPFSKAAPNDACGYEPSDLEILESSVFVPKRVPYEQD